MLYRQNIITSGVDVNTERLLPDRQKKPDDTHSYHPANQSAKCKMQSAKCLHFAL